MTVLKLSIKWYIDRLNQEIVLGEHRIILTVGLHRTGFRVTTVLSSRAAAAVIQLLRRSFIEPIFEQRTQWSVPRHCFTDVTGPITRTRKSNKMNRKHVISKLLPAIAMSRMSLWMSPLLSGQQKKVISSAIWHRSTILVKKMRVHTTILCIMANKKKRYSYPRKTKRHKRTNSR